MIIITQGELTVITISKDKIIVILRVLLPGTRHSAKCLMYILSHLVLLVTEVSFYPIF